MRILFYKNFNKAYKKLSPKLKRKTDDAIKKFRSNPYDKTLGNHKLTGELAGKSGF